MSYSSLFKPLLFSVPLNINKSSCTIILHEHQVYEAPGGLQLVRNFSDNGEGGFISAAQSGNGKWGYINQYGQWLINPSFEDARAFSEDGFSRFKENGRWGYVNNKGQIVIAAQFEDTHAFKFGMAAVQLDNKRWGFINHTGKLAFENIFSFVGDFTTCGLAMAAESVAKGGYINRMGQWVIKPMFMGLRPFNSQGTAPACLKQKKYGLINLQGEWVLAPAYERIDKFNQDGLAYFSDDQKSGYLNAKGEVVIRFGEYNFRPMRDGVVSANHSGSAYFLKDASLLPTPPLSWGGDFNEFGYTVVRTADSMWSKTLQRHEELQAQWGILRKDGSFKPLPPEIQEPLTDAEGWIVSLINDTPFLPCLTTNKEIVFIDREACIAYRICYQNECISFLDAKGVLLWQSSQGQQYRPPSAFFHQSIEAFLKELDSLENIVPCAHAVLRETEKKLHAFVAGEDLAEDLEEEDEDEEDPEEKGESSVATRRCLARAYIGEEHYGSYEFLSRLQTKTIIEAKTTLLSTLIQHFGPADPDPEYPRNSYSQYHITSIPSAWPVNLQQGISGVKTSLKEATQLWLSFYEHVDSGDGDVWHELWLLCAPSIDALEAAKQARRALSNADSEGTTPEGGKLQPDGTQLQQLPQTYEQWLAAVREDKCAMGHVPETLIDDALVNAALEANAKALEYVPPKWQTSQRLERLIRKGVAVALEIPEESMTEDGLTLARALYAQDLYWQQEDHRRSQLPSKWEKNCLYGVWGAVLTEEHCIAAVSAGEDLNDVPHWLRTDRVEQAALKTDIYNIRYIAKEHITSALAERAVRHDYGCLIEVIPQELLTPDLCLTSVRINGLSLQHIPLTMRSIEVCVAAMQENSSVFVWVPEEIRLVVCSRLIELDLAQAPKEQEDEQENRVSSRWHSYRAWAKLWAKDYEGAIEDAKLALEQARYPVHSYYVLASAYRALNQFSQAALQASCVLALADPYTAEFHPQEDTSWLNQLTQGHFENLDEATLLLQIQESPLALADVPRERITEEMIENALARNAEAIRFVPKRLMTPERYVIAMQENVKRFSNIPQSMLSEAACIEHVSRSGYRLADIPEQWRTVQVCAYALRNTTGALSYVPTAIQIQVQEALKSLPAKDDVEANTADASSSGLEQRLINSMLSEKSEKTTLHRLSRKGLWAAFFLKTVFLAKDDKPPILKGVAGWMEQRPVATLFINGITAALALVFHMIVTIHVWQTHGTWIGLLTGIFMGFAEIYWGWQFLFSDPFYPGLGIAAVFVMFYVFGYTILSRRVNKAIAAKHHQLEK